MLGHVFHVAHAHARGAVFLFSPSAFGGISTAAAADVFFVNINTVFQTVAALAVGGVRR
jgi:hypothetical protein